MRKLLGPTSQPLLRFIPNYSVDFHIAVGGLAVQEGGVRHSNCLSVGDDLDVLERVGPD